MAKKNGKPNDDFPSKNISSSLRFIDIETSTNIAKTNVTRFALCLDKKAVLKIQPAPASGYDTGSLRDHMEKNSTKQESGHLTLDKALGDT